MLISLSGDDFLEMSNALAMMDVEDPGASNTRCVFVPTASSLPSVLALVHLRENFLLLQSLLQAYRDESPMLSESFSLEQMKQANFDDTDPILQKVYHSLNRRSRRPPPDSKDVMKEHFHYVLRRNDGSSAQSDVDQPGRMPALVLEAVSVTKTLLVRYTAWIKAMEACQISNVFLFDFCRRIYYPCDVFVHPIVFYDLFATEPFDAQNKVRTSWK
jgi:hypothetical protein